MNMIHSRYHGKNADDPKSDRKTIQGLKDRHGWDDETVRQSLADAHSVIQGSKKQRVMQAIHNQEMMTVFST